jgi:hypothetical protein
MQRPCLQNQYLHLLFRCGNLPECGRAIANVNAVVVVIRVLITKQHQSPERNNNQ